MLSAGFERILREHESMVYGIAYRFFRSSAVAEQLTEDVFTQLFRSHSDGMQASAIVAWLRRTATMRCIDVSRSAGCLREVQNEPLPEAGNVHSVSDPLAGEWIRRFVTLLPETPRAVLVLRYGEEMTPEEIGHTLDMPEATVGSHLRHALALLHELATHALAGAVVARER